MFYSSIVNRNPSRHIPAWIAFGVIIAVCLVRLARFDYLEKLERMTFDMRARLALKAPSHTATNLGFVFIDEETVRIVADPARPLGYNYGLLWPRHIYGRVLNELQEQGARAIAFDILLGELRSDHLPVRMADGRVVDSDEFFALQMKRTSNVVIAFTKEVAPPPLFATNAISGDITTERDSDGILRRARAFRMYRNWHRAFRQAEEDPNIHVDLSKARIEPGKIILPLQDGGKDVEIPLDKEGRFDLTGFVGDKIPKGMERWNKPYTDERVWHMGIVLAAIELGLDLRTAEVHLEQGKIVLRGSSGIMRTLPVDRQGYFYVDWCLPVEDPKLTKEAMHSLLSQNRMRLEGRTEGLTNRWRGKLAIVGSSAVMGNNMTDRGATPLSPDTVLVGKHWNVANSIITGQMVRRSSLAFDLLAIVVMGLIAAVLTWRLQVVHALGLVLATGAVYVVFCCGFYAQSRFWMPVILPIMGAMLMNYVCLASWRIIFEQAERRRVRSIFSRIVSPKIVDELLRTDTLALGGARREITVLFADVRGFTEFTDLAQERAAEFVQTNKLTPSEAEACFDEEARETLATVNLYLGLVAEIIIKHDGTLDKFIGDCVMAFWGAPTHNPGHAKACVSAAIEAQQAVQKLNEQRAEQNRQRELENTARVSSGLRPKPLVPLLLLGTGINTGMATVGLMGSQLEQQNYTVFGREVNLASRLEGLSGRGRIFISQATHEHLKKDDPVMAARCIEQAPARVKGIGTAVICFEVPWAQPVKETIAAETAGTASTPELSSLNIET